MKKIVKTDHAPQAIGPYSQATIANGFIFVSGQIPMDPETGELVENDIRVQTRRSMDSVKAILEEAGATLGDIVKSTVYLADIDDFVVMNTEYAKYFPFHAPARACIQVARLPKDALIEIEVVATIGSKYPY